MRLSTSLRTGSVRWAAPFVILLTIFYYIVGQTTPVEDFLGYAPSIVATPLVTLYALAYTVAAALATWEGGRMTSSGMWAMAPARSRFRVAANSLMPVILLAWLVPLLPTCISLIRASTIPTIDSLRLPAMALVLCVVHAAIGFAIGLRTPRLIAAPLMAVTVLVLVAFSRAVHPYWLRHVSGQFGSVGFSEVPSAISLMAPILFAGSIAVGFTMMWLPFRTTLGRAALACVVAGSGTCGAYFIAHDWPHAPPLIIGQAPMTCLGNAPKVCMPQATSGDLASVRRETVSVLEGLRENGVTRTPSVITDRLADGRYSIPSTKHTWRMSLTYAVQQDNVRYQTLLSATRFPCKQPNEVTGRAPLLWAAAVTGQQKEFNKHMSQLEQTSEALRMEKQVQDLVHGVLSQPKEKQATWFRNSLTDACSQGSR